MESDSAGRVILLNGASSSGKSSIGRALQQVLPDPWFLFPVDALGAMRSTEHTGVLDQDEIGAMLRRTRLGYHRAVAALASVGNDVIMDYPLSADELDRRERARGDRPAGLARSQRVFRHDDRDIEVDTTHLGPQACAVTIASELDALGTDMAFDRLRRRRS